VDGPLSFNTMGYKVAMAMMTMMTMMTMRSRTMMMTSSDAADVFPPRSMQRVEPHGLVKTFMYTFRFFNLIDILSIAPYYIALVVGGKSLSFLRILRLARVRCHDIPA
jgi:hypothetical protein